jgi:poly(hydroxyalkanoate) granule-associated protein
MNDAGRAGDKSRLKLAPAKDLRKYTQQIWLAGLGAFARAEEEGGKLFDNLVKLGEELETKTKEIADTTVGEMREKVLEKATDTKERVERVFDDRITTTLSRLGIPTQKEMDSLNQKLDALTTVIAQLSEQIRKDNAKNGKG